jgi:hypothetical protein
MARALLKLDFFTDENIPDSVCRYLQGRGHSVFKAKAHLPEGSADPVVATAAMEDNRILLTWDKDFNDQRYQQGRFARLNRIGLSGEGPDLVVAFKRHIRVIEFQYGEAVRERRRFVAFAKVDQVRFKR